MGMATAESRATPLPMQARQRRRAVAPPTPAVRGAALRSHQPTQALRQRPPQALRQRPLQHRLQPCSLHTELQALVAHVALRGGTRAVSKGMPPL